jgi:hypothetical protein
LKTELQMNWIAIYTFIFLYLPLAGALIILLILGIKYLKNNSWEIEPSWILITLVILISAFVASYWWGAIGFLTAIIVSPIILAIIYLVYSFFIDAKRKYWRNSKLFFEDIGRATIFIIILLILLWAYWFLSPTGTLIINKMGEAWAWLGNTWFAIALLYLLKYVLILIFWIFSLGASLLFGVGISLLPIKVGSFIFQKIFKKDNLPILRFSQIQDGVEAASLIFAYGISIFFTIWIFLKLFLSFLLDINYTSMGLE